MTAETQRIIDLQLELWNTGSREIAKQLYSEHAERTDPNGRDPIRHRGVHQIASFVAEVRAPPFQISNFSSKRVSGKAIISPSIGQSREHRKASFKAFPPAASVSKSAG